MVFFSSLSDSFLLHLGWERTILSSCRCSVLYVDAIAAPRRKTTFVSLKITDFTRRSATAAVAGTLYDSWYAILLCAPFSTCGLESSKQNRKPGFKDLASCHQLSAVTRHTFGGFTRNRRACSAETAILFTVCQNIPAANRRGWVVTTSKLNTRTQQTRTECELDVLNFSIWSG